MPVYHFILHAYGTWHPDHPSGWHQHNDPGLKKPNPLLAAHRRKRQRFPTVSFSDNLQHQLLERTLTFCARHRTRPLAAATSDTHFHAVISWTDDTSADHFQSTLKRSLALLCAQHESTPNRQWFSEGGNPIPVKNRPHLNHLLEEYLPQQGRLLWREGEPIKKVHGRA